MNSASPLAGEETCRKKSGRHIVLKSVVGYTVVHNGTISLDTLTCLKTNPFTVSSPSHDSLSNDSQGVRLSAGVFKHARMGSPLLLQRPPQGYSVIKPSRKRRLDCYWGRGRERTGRRVDQECCPIRSLPRWDNQTAAKSTHIRYDLLNLFCCFGPHPYSALK